MQTFPTLYKRDSAGKIRTWFMELDGSRYRTHAGLQMGEMVVSEWTVVNRPRSQETVEAQAEFEVKAAYEHQLKRDYFASVDDIDSPRFFAPMLAHKYEGWPGKAVYAQPKLDGIRAIISARGAASREGQPIFTVDHILRALAPFFDEFPDAVLDGELYNHALKDDFNRISSLVRKKKPTTEQLQEIAENVSYWVYDYPSHGDKTFGTRISLLGNHFAQTRPDAKVVVPVPTYHVEELAKLDELYGEWLGQGFEGQMVRLNALYEQKRSKTLLKRKEFQDAEYEVVSIEEGQGNWSGVAKRVVCRLPDGRTFGAGVKGSKQFCKELLGQTHHQVTVRFFALTPDGIPRLPVATAFHGTEGRL